MALNSDIISGASTALQAVQKIREAIAAEGGNDDDLRRLLQKGGPQLTKRIAQILTEKQPYLLLHANENSFPTVCSLQWNEVYDEVVKFPIREPTDQFITDALDAERSGSFVPFDMDRQLVFHLLCSSSDTDASFNFEKMCNKLKSWRRGHKENEDVGYHLANLSEAVLFRNHWRHVVRASEKIFVMTESDIWEMTPRGLKPIGHAVVGEGQEIRILSVDKQAWIKAER